MTPDEQEARWRKYSDDRIILLPLKSGNIAVFNNAAEFCGIVEPKQEASDEYGFFTLDTFDECKVVGLPTGMARNGR
jgi:UPF0288 family protein (methanogenesis marker protein 3)